MAFDSRRKDGNMHAAARGRGKRLLQRQGRVQAYIKTSKLIPTRLSSSRHPMMHSDHMRYAECAQKTGCGLCSHVHLALKKRPGWNVASRVINVEGRRWTYTLDVFQPDMI